MDFLVVVIYKDNAFEWYLAENDEVFEKRMLDLAEEIANEAFSDSGYANVWDFIDESFANAEDLIVYDTNRLDDLQALAKFRKANPELTHDATE